MATKVWTFELDGVRQVVEVEHGWWGGKRIIKLNGKEIDRERKVFDTGTEHRFKIDSHECQLRIRTIFDHFEYELFIDGKLI